MSDNDRNRDLDGKYGHRLDAVCVCGCPRGSHDADRVKIDGAWYCDCHACDDCPGFKKARKKKAPKG